jgi:RNA polymerase sigma-70 factor, ECF subfamily
VDAGWEQVYAGHYHRLVAMVTALAGSRPDAEEAVQEAFVRAMGPTGRRRVIDNPEAWLYQVAVNVVRSRWRRTLAGRRATAQLAARDVIGGTPDVSESRMVLVAALQQVPFEQREVLVLHYLADLAVEDIAARLGTPVGTVKSRLSRGRDALARLLADGSAAGGVRRA